LSARRRPLPRLAAAASTAAAALALAGPALAGQGLFITSTNALPASADDPTYPRVTLHARGQEVCWYTNDLANWDVDDDGRPMNARPGGTARQYTEVQNSGFCNTVYSPERGVVRYRQFGYHIRESAGSPWEPLTWDAAPSGTAMLLYQNIQFDPYGWTFYVSGPRAATTRTASGRVVCVTVTPRLDHITGRDLGVRFSPGPVCGAAGDAGPRVTTLRMRPGDGGLVPLGAWAEGEARWRRTGCTGDAVRVSGARRLGGGVAMTAVRAAAPGTVTCTFALTSPAGGTLARRALAVVVG
jgi:hypothetical protein